MSQSFLFALVVVIVLVIIVARKEIPERFFILQDPVPMNVLADPLEFARLEITDYASVYDGQDYVF